MSIQPPELVANLYGDLRERRLLPLIVVLLAGMVVVPIALSESPRKAASAAPDSGSAVPSKTSVPATEVVLSDPGLRDYRRRLNGEIPKDPFAAQLQSSASEGSASAANGVGAGSLTGNSSSGGEVGLTAEGKEAAANAVPEAGATPGSGSFGQVSEPTADSPSTTTDTTSKGDSKVVFYRLKIRSGVVGGNMKVQEDVGPSSSLPSKSVPALAFLGASLDSNLKAKRAFFLISNGVSSISGDGQCTLGDPCQMLALKPGQYMDLVWTDGVAYRVKLLDFERHVRDTPVGQPGG